MTTKTLSGTGLHQKYSYGKLESIAGYVRSQLNVSHDQAIDPLRLFEDLHQILVSEGNTMIPLRGGVIDLEDSEGYTRYDRNKRVIEILASARTYGWLEEGHPRGLFRGA